MSLREKVNALKERAAKWIAPSLVTRLETATRAALEITKLRNVPGITVYHKECGCKCRSKKHSFARSVR